nr:MAG TPA: hypothetical protein [Caudoviricetes sp.]
MILIKKYGYVHYTHTQLLKALDQELYELHGTPATECI